MAFNYILFKDNLYECAILRDYHLVDKTVRTIGKLLTQQINEQTQQPEFKWLTYADLRKNTTINAGDIEIICSVLCNIGMIKSKYENARVKAQFDPSFMLLDDKVLLDKLKLIEKEGLSQAAIRAMRQKDFAAQNPHSRNRRKNLQKVLESSEITDSTIDNEVLTNEVKNLQSTVTQSKRYRRSIIDDPQQVAYYSAQKALEAGTINTLTAKELHEQQKCTPEECRFCAFEKEQQEGLGL